MAVGKLELDDLRAAGFIRQAQRLRVLRDLREITGLTEAEAAEAVPMARSTLIAWEKGRSLPRGGKAIRYGQILLALLPLEAVDEVATSSLTERLQRLALKPESEGEV